MDFPITYIPIFNIILLLIPICCIYSGMKSGIFKLIDIAGSILSIILAWVIAPHLITVIKLLPMQFVPFHDTVLGPILYDYLNRYFVFFLLFFIFGLILSGIRIIVKNICKIKIFRECNKMIGIILGVIQTLIIYVVISIVLSTPLFSNGTEVQSNSILKFVQPVKNVSLSFVKNQFVDFEEIQRIIKPVNGTYTKDQINQIKTLLIDLKVPQDEINSYVDELLKKYGYI